MTSLQWTSPIPVGRYEFRVAVAVLTALAYILMALSIHHGLLLRIRPFSFPQWPDCGILKNQDQAGEPFMGKDPEEWFRQADYDLETAEDLFNGGRYFYEVLEWIKNQR